MRLACLQRHDAPIGDASAAAGHRNFMSAFRLSLSNAFKAICVTFLHITQMLAELQVAFFEAIANGTRGKSALGHGPR